MSPFAARAASAMRIGKGIISNPCRAQGMPPLSHRRLTWSQLQFATCARSTPSPAPRKCLWGIPIEPWMTLVSLMFHSSGICSPHKGADPGIRGGGGRAGLADRQDRGAPRAKRFGDPGGRVGGWNHLMTAAQPLPIAHYATVHPMFRRHCAGPLLKADDIALASAVVSSGTCLPNCPRQG